MRVYVDAKEKESKKVPEVPEVVKVNVEEKFVLGLENSDYYVREIFDLMVSRKRPLTPLEIRNIERLMMSGKSLIFMAYLTGKLVKACEGGLDG